MKKRNLKSLKFLKKTISNLNYTPGIMGGATVFPCPADTDFRPCQSINHCGSEDQKCNSQATTTCLSIPGYCNSTQPLCPPDPGFIG